MEGTLWKWTNYWNGWQTRWFVLENGVLTYYKSQEEANQGCKGSIKIQACEINVSNIDLTRLDLVIPGEQHLYLRAATSLERQKWLVALGTAKACVQNKNRKDSCESKQFNSEANPDTLKTKKSELRLYCDLLMQQVHVVKTATKGENGPEVIKKMDEATSLLSATCDTFIKTLEECMKLSNANIIYELSLSNDLIIPPTPINLNPPNKKTSKNVVRLNSNDSQ